MRGTSLKDALTFKWTSVTGNLDPARMRAIDQFVVGNLVVDVGCAGGAYARYLESRGFHVVRFDLSHELLKFARQRAGTDRCICGDILYTPFKDGSFDTALVFDLLEHVEDIPALRELARITRRFVIATVPLEIDPTFLRHGLVYSHYRDPTHLRYYTEHSARVLFENASLDVIHLEGILDIDVLHLLRELIEGDERSSWKVSLLFRLLRRAQLRRISTALLIVGVVRR